MDQAVKTEWVKALRSGEYKQGKGRLMLKDAEGNTTFCCLGVLCNILGMKANPAGMYRDKTQYSFGHTYNASYPTTEVMSLVGLTHDQARLLAIMNDDGNSFKAIADYIEKHL